MRARIWLLLLIAVVLVVASSAAMRTSYRTVANAGDNVSQTLRPAAASMATLDNAIAAMNSGTTAYAITGSTDDLRVYVAGSTRAGAEIRRLRSLLAFDAVLSSRLKQTSADLRAWRTEGLEPIIDAARSQDAAGRKRAQRLVADGPSRDLLAGVLTSRQSLDQLILSEAQFALQEQERAFVRLWWILNAAVFVLLLVVGLFAWLLLRSVLRPLKQLQGQMLDAAQSQDHEDPIVPSGPPELTEVGKDAESMRRQLVKQIDRSRQADEGLEQQRPALAAIRAELSASHPPDVAGLDLFGDQMPAEGVMAGDWWSAQLLDDGRVAIALTDVSGHGPEAAIEALRLKNVLELSLSTHADPARALWLAARGTTKADRFATCAVVVIDPITGDLEWANAGHPQPLLLAQGTCRSLEPTGPLLSVLGGQWHNRSTQMGLGDLLVMVTDGITESRDADGEELGQSGLAELIARAATTEITCAGVVGNVVSAARARAVDWRRDDATCVAVRRTNN